MLICVYEHYKEHNFDKVYVEVNGSFGFVNINIILL